MSGRDRSRDQSGTPSFPLEVSRIVERGFELFDVVIGRVGRAREGRLKGKQVVIEVAMVGCSFP